MRVEAERNLNQLTNLTPSMVLWHYWTGNGASTSCFGVELEGAILLSGSPHFRKFLKGCILQTVIDDWLGDRVAPEKVSVVGG